MGRVDEEMVVVVEVCGAHPCRAVVAERRDPTHQCESADPGGAHPDGMKNHLGVAIIWVLTAENLRLNLEVTHGRSGL
ncbi:hypothetical protein Skr01_43820 [Sphaerisporangium krabiense]|nr:hypothetical protein Skr01_43820 [Sphaerisporangium krabiense]